MTALRRETAPATAGALSPPNVPGTMPCQAQPRLAPPCLAAPRPATPRLAVRPRVYATHPMTSYGTAHERQCLDRLAELLPSCEIVNPAERYSTNVGWLRAWPRLLPTLAGLVVFGAEDGTIGTGCWREIGDAITWRLPVAALAGGALCEIDAVQLLALPWRSARRVGRVMLGPALEPRELFPSIFDGVVAARNRW